MSHISRIAITLASTALLIAAAGCSGDDDSSTSSSSSSSSSSSGGSSSGGSSASPEAACTNLCTQTGFSASRVDVQPNETNCFCQGPGTVTTEACASFCTGIEKSTPTVFKSGTSATKNDACQCS